ncbi:nitrate reductase cytochrome c-type subunit [Aliikangiella sp. G2MR2-5]|uniref:nitrate reductase cytochrome c-type subunit n=1 Tax=Aliikangiella sp. G2MR2-5 TaxID=2788943 RepID=UPI0018A8C7EE|nr:nitrate reductase cytochrome c-type subunit [Aliikangiella sp. G2MR2-5]
MKKLIYAITAAVMLSILLPKAQSEDLKDNGGVISLRGQAQLFEQDKAEDMKRVQRDQSPIARDYLHQPPLIPHQTRNYKINTNSNKCLSCHSWKNYRKSGATKISMTHFETRDRQQLSDVSPRRYFCTQCHVTQADAEPLIANDFKPVEELSGGK